MGVVGREGPPWPPFIRERGWGVTQTCSNFPCRTTGKGDTAVNPCLEVLTTTRSDKTLSRVLHSSRSKANPLQECHVPWTPVGQLQHFPRHSRGAVPMRKLLELVAQGGLANSGSMGDAEVSQGV